MNCQSSILSVSGFQGNNLVPILPKNSARLAASLLFNKLACVGQKPSKITRLADAARGCRFEPTNTAQMSFATGAVFKTLRDIKVVVEPGHDARDFAEVPVGVDLGYLRAEVVGCDEQTTVAAAFLIPQVGLESDEHFDFPRRTWTSSLGDNCQANGAGTGNRFSARVRLLRSQRRTLETSALKRIARTFRLIEWSDKLLSRKRCVAHQETMTCN